MATAAQARDRGRARALRGIGDSLYTPFCGVDGDDIDWDAYRTLVRYCVADLGHPNALVHQRYRRVLVADHRRAKALAGSRDRGRRAPPTRCRHPGLHRGDVGQGLPGTDAARAAVGRRHRLHPDPDDGDATAARACCASSATSPTRTDIALGMFNSPSSGYVLTAAESARIYDEIPAVCATKEGAFRPRTAGCCTSWRRILSIWECDLTVYRAGWLREGIVCRGSAGHRRLPATRRRSARICLQYWDLICNEQADRGNGLRARRPGMDQFDLDMGSWFICYPGRADYFTHWGGAFKYAASCWACRSATTRIPGHRRRVLPDGGQDADRRCLPTARTDAKRLVEPDSDSAGSFAALAECTTDRYTVCVHQCIAADRQEVPLGECCR